MACQLVPVADSSESLQALGVFGEYLTTNRLDREALDGTAQMRLGHTSPHKFALGMWVAFRAISMRVKHILLLCSCPNRLLVSSWIVTSRR